MNELVSLDQINNVFHVYEIRTNGPVTRYYGEPLVAGKTLLASLWNDFAERGYELELKREHGEFVLLAIPVSNTDEKKHINVILAIATAFAITLTGAVFFYGVDPITDPFLIYKGLPFAAAVMFVLGSHELAHYFVAKRRGMKASLPFFIPLPLISPVGTLGALIRLKGAIPDRKSLFDVGIAGPLVGLAAAIVITIVGLLLPPVTAGASQAQTFALGTPLLFSLIEKVVPVTSTGMHPLAFAGWVGMLITSLNLLPVGQLDGGHIARAISGEKTTYISAAVPIVLMATGVFYSLNGLNGDMLLFWGFFTLVFATGGHPRPINDTKKLDNLRIVLGILAFGLCIACFTPIPIQA
ncbi:MAG: site-2 protease family protein [Halobacteriota archaeon]